MELFWWMTPFLFLEILLRNAVVAAAQSSGTPYCSRSCGAVTIPFPFGIEEGCALNEDFAVTCSNTSDSTTPKPRLKSINLELLDVDLSAATVSVNNPVFSSNCASKTSYPTSSVVNFSGSPFTLSSSYNIFTAIGCDNYAVLRHRNGSIIGGCLSTCNTTNGMATNKTISGCYGQDCCRTTIPPGVKYYEVNMTLVFKKEASGCRSAFMVDPEWLTDNTTNLDEVSRKEYVPVKLRWATYQGYCAFNGSTNVECNANSGCSQKLGPGQLCYCESCSDVASCIGRSPYSGSLFCLEGYGCLCPPGFYYSNITDGCYPEFKPEPSRSSNKAIVIGCASGFGSLFMLVVAWWLYKVIKRRRAFKLRQKFFKRNGGLLLQQQLSSTETNVEQTKVFASKELEKATDYYHVNRILGQGGQGTVYKGMLTDGRIVAVKKSKVVDEDKLEEFINEVVILSQINHRNVVKLFGCCLETEVPLLVYEFIPNGTLFEYLHKNVNEDHDQLPMTWETRLRIATEVAGALSYLHSAASIPIYHRDIKSSNILLDDKYRAKVSDFGSSKSISIDQTHVTTRVQGTFGYLDPEYFQSSQFTEKSDVYSFGVVLVELLTGQKPISSIRSAEERSLATYFLIAMEQNCLFDILDATVLKEGRKEEIVAVAELARRCLNLNGRYRPTMKTAAMVLEGTRVSQQGNSATIQQDYDEVAYVAGGETGPWDVESSSTGSCLTAVVSASAPLDVEPLLLNTV